MHFVRMKAGTAIVNWLVIFMNGVSVPCENCNGVYIY